jgi:hypothetical protein
MTGSDGALGGRHAGEMGRDGIRGNCLALSVIGTGRMRTWMPGEQRQALERGFRSGGLGQSSNGATALFIAAAARSQIAGPWRSPAGRSCYER